MTLPSSGPLSLNDINGEFGLGTNLNAYRGVTWYTNAGSSGTFTSTNLGIDQFYSKRSTPPAFSVHVTTNQQNLNLRSYAVSAGWNGTQLLWFYIDSGVYVWSDDSSLAALTISGSFPNSVVLYNSGYIMGKGGMGGGWDLPGYTYLAGQSGGPAISLGASCTIYNYAYIGGGGGGGGVTVLPGYGTLRAAGGGAGGGAGGVATDWVLVGNSGSAAGGTVGNSGANGAQYATTWTSSWVGGGGGGRIMPGSTSAQASCPSTYQIGYGAGGSGGGGGAAFTTTTPPATGGTGEGYNNTGGNSSGDFGAGGGGGYGASGGSGSGGSGWTVYGPGSGGKAIALNGYTATISAGSSNIFGSIS